MKAANEVDHKIPKARGGSDYPENLQSLCTPCHREKTAKENGKKSIGCSIDGIPTDPDHPWND